MNDLTRDQLEQHLQWIRAERQKQVARHEQLQQALNQQERIIWAHDGAIETMERLLAATNGDPLQGTEETENEQN